MIICEYKTEKKNRPLHLQLKFLILNHTLPSLPDRFPLEGELHHLTSIENAEPHHVVEMEACAIDVPSRFHWTGDEASLSYDML